MPLVFRTLHRPTSADQLNDEWMILENTGPNTVTAKGCALTVARSAKERPRSLGTLDPGFVLHPNEKIRLVTGSPAKKAEGTPPADQELTNYHLFLKAPVLERPGSVVRLSVNQAELARAVFQPDAPNGIGGPSA